MNGLPLMQAMAAHLLRRASGAALILLACGLAASCSEAASTASETPPSPAVSPTPEPAAGPLLRVEDLSLYPDPAGGSWWLGGLIQNLTESSLQDITLAIAVRGADGSQAQMTLPLAWTLLLPGETAPFEVLLGAQEPQSVEVEPEAIPRQNVERVPVAAEEIRVVRDGFRRQDVLGWVVNAEDRAAEVAAALAVARDAGNAIVDVAPLGEGGFRLAAGERRPFVARLETRQPVVSVQVYFDAAPAEAAIHAPAAEVVRVDMRIGPNGLPYWVGLIRNDNPSWLWVSGVASVSAEGELVGAANVWLPVPVMPGESLAFALADVPGVEGWLREGGDPAALQVQVWLDTRRLPEQQAVHQLDLRVQSVEAIGGTLFLRALVQFPADEALERASIVAALRDTVGNLVSAGGVEVEAGSGPGTAAGFLLALPLPAGVQPAGLEYDLRAVALR